MVDRLILWWLITRRLRRLGNRDISVSVTRGTRDPDSGSIRHNVVLRRSGAARSIQVWWDGRKLHRCWCTDSNSHQVDNTRRQVVVRVVDLAITNGLPVVSA
ncbi:MAG: hypothetical protein U0136_12260 [Bdellovibrionota bacterium]